MKMIKGMKKARILLLAAALSFSSAGCGLSNADAGSSADSAAGGSAAEEAGSFAAEDVENAGAADISGTSGSVFAGAGDAGGSSTERENEQTVTVKADPAGKVYRVLLRNSEDDIEEELGAEDMQKLPFDVSVKYYLENQPVSADEIAGKTGNIRIRFDYKNKTAVKEKIDSKEVQTIVPFAFLTAVVLPGDRFRDVSVVNGEISSMQDNQIAIGYAMPGLEDVLALEAVEDALDGISFDPDNDNDSRKDGGGANTGKDNTDTDDAGRAEKEKERTDEEKIPTYVEISAYAENFKIDFTATIVTNGLLSGTEDHTIDELKNTIGDLQEIADAGNDLQDGTEELRNGAGEFRDGLSQYVDGAGSLAKGASQLNAGIKKLNENGTALADGAAQLSDALAELNKALTQAAESTSGGKDAGADSTAAPELNLDAEALAAQMTENAAEAVMEQLSDNEALTEEEKAAAAQAAGSAAAMAAGADLQAAAEQLKTAAGGLQASGAEQLEALKNGLDQLSELQNGIAELTEGASSLQQGVRAYTDGVAQLADGAVKLSDGAGKLYTSGSQLLSGYDKMRDGIAELADGIKDMNRDGMQKIGNAAEHELTDTLDQFRALVLADRGHTALGVYNGKEGAVRYILETDEVTSVK